MESKYKAGVTDNVFKNLSEEHSLFLMGLSLASNDLFINLDTFKHYPASESNYFFAICISILREVALLVVDIKKTDFTQQFSSDTNELFEKLISELAPYNGDSLVKSALRPIRNFTFHYNLKKQEEKDLMISMINNVKSLKDIDIGLDSNEKSALGQRYIFADTFRADFINHFLSKDIVSNISSISVDIGNFVDSLMYDLYRGNKGTRK